MALSSDIRETNNKNLPSCTGPQRDLELGNRIIKGHTLNSGKQNYQETFIPHQFS